MDNKSLDKQFAGNYVRLVNKSRSLEQEVILKDKMIYLILSDIYSDKTFEWAFDKFKTKALEQLVAEQNKKAAEVNNVI